MLEIINREILSISRGDLLIDGIENDEDMGPLEIEFADGSVVIISLVSDGESIEYNFSPSKSNRLLVQDSEWERVILSDKHPYSYAKSRCVSHTNALLFSTEYDKKPVIAGYRLKLEDGNSIVYYNAGDFAKIYWNDIPPKLPRPFNLKWE